MQAKAENSDYEFMKEVCVIEALQTAVPQLLTLSDASRLRKKLQSVLRKKAAAFSCAFFSLVSSEVL